MGKYNKKVKGKEKKRLEKLQEEFNPSARDPYIAKKEKEKEERLELLEEEMQDLKDVLKSIEDLNTDEDKE